MPPKRRAVETEASNHPNGISFGQAEAPPSAVQPAPVKRQRVSRACDQCRAARERCDGKQPECHPCISQSRPCTYEVSPKKRGVQTGYIRTLELALGWVFEKVPGSEEALGALFAHEGGHRAPFLAGQDPSGADRLQKRWRNSRVHRRIDRILSGEASAPSPEHHALSPSADASDNEGNQAPARAEPDSAVLDAASVIQETSNFRRRSLEHCPPNAEERKQVPSDGMRTSPQASSGRIKLPANHWRLLDIYLSYTHSWLPILEKQDLFQASYSYPDEGLSIDRSDSFSAVHAVLWAALALASFQDTGSSKSASSDHSNPPKLPPGEIYDTARGLLPSEDGPFQIHHAQAFLILSLVNLGQGKLASAGLFVGSATRILLDPDLIRHVTHDQGDPRVRLALMSCFMIDTILSVRYSRPPHLRPQDLAAVQLVSENGHDQWEPWTPCDGFGLGNTGYCSSRSPAFRLSTFNQLYTIIKVLAEELSTRTQRSVSRGSSSAFVTQLQHVIDPNLPFNNFILSPACGSISVPTPYLVRATYLWASAIVEPQRAGTLLPLLQDTLVQYQRLFGRSTTPPFLHTCVASLENGDYVSRCGEQSQELLRRLLSTFSCTPFGGGRSSTVRDSHSNLLSQETQDTLSQGLSQSSASGNTLLIHPTAMMPRLYGSPTGPQQLPSHLTNRSYNSLSGQNFPEIYQLQSHGQPLTIPQGGDTRTRRSGSDVAAMSGLSTATAPSHGDMPSSYHLFPHTGLGPSPDVDALLDDLSSIEYTDTADADPQFMANLGFAPGCDITEILTRGFGGA